ncbi:hypothetical protein MED121_12810 [Marinomonas sp. MED121]|uniref:DUF7793 family protein n=1 Tax=Marinomonas sp. MED121 TaxID=314277 RepID=UPI000068FF70|nr:STAS/SEC14 domain-containing protein [Marinomonas sp. MED121]EAQ66808.1 hypothetical protein MED121_12810 [Marinomonas sp. MED121]
MFLDDLPFGLFMEIEPNIMEVIINEGVQISRQQIEQMEQGLLQKYQDHPYSLLINRKNAYSHEHDALSRVAELKNVEAMAIIAYTDATAIAAKMHLLYSNNIQIFTDKASALNWLKQNQ